MDRPTSHFDIKTTHLQDIEHLTPTKKIKQFYHAPVIKFWNNVVRTFDICVLANNLLRDS